jgi:hypothetical protein
MVTKTRPFTTTVYPENMRTNLDGSWFVQSPPLSFAQGSTTYEDRARGTDWKALIKSGQDATTQGTGFSTKWDGTQSHLLARNQSNGQYDGQMAVDTTAVNGLPASHFDKARQLAIADFIGNAKAAQHEFNAGEFLGEIAETLRFVGSPLTSFHRYSKNYLRRMQDKAVWVGTKRTKRARLASAWLGYRFGALPLLGDIDSAMEELAKFMVGKPPTIPVRGKGLDGQSTNDVTSGGNLGKWNYLRNVKVDASTQTTIRGRVSTTIPTQIIWTPGTVRVFEEFIPTLWEIMPWSWAIDYFTNVGDLISCITYLDCNLTWVNQTQRSQRVTKEILTYSPNGALGWTILDSQGRRTTTTKTLWNRDKVAPSSLVPKLVLKTPFGKPLKMANLTAALFQTFHH